MFRPADTHLTVMQMKEILPDIYVNESLGPYRLPSFTKNELQLLRSIRDKKPVAEIAKIISASI